MKKCDAVSEQPLQQPRVPSSKCSRGPHVTFSACVSTGGLNTSSAAVATGRFSGSVANNVHLNVAGQRPLAQQQNDGKPVAAVTDKCGSGTVVKTKVRQTDYPARSANEYIWKKIESIVEKMQSEENGVPIGTVKSLMSTVPSVFTGTDIISWIMRYMKADDVSEAAHVASMISSMGYLFPIADHILQVKNDAHSLYRFQTPCLYPSKCVEVDNFEYAVYLCKRTMQNKQRLELADFEAERLATLQSFYWHKWDFIYLQAEAEAKVDKKRDKVERLVLESQEKGFWDTNRPVSGSVNNNDIDMRKLCRAKRPKKAATWPSWFPIPAGPNGALIWDSLDGISPSEKVMKLQSSYEKKRKPISKSIDCLHSYNDQYLEFDMLLTAAPSGGLLSNLTSSTSSGNATSTNITTTTAAPQTQSPGAPSGTNPNAPTWSGTMENISNGTEPSSSALNPWVNDSSDFWASEVSLKDVSVRRVKRWGFSIYELLKDPAGKEEIQKWLEKEFSVENLRFWEACQELKGAPLKEVNRRIEEIYNQFLAPTAVDPLNVDSKVAESVRNKVAKSSGSNPDRFCFEEAEEHIFKLMTNDSYYRFLRSNFYKELIAGQKKKSKRKFPTDIRQRLEIEG